MCNTGGDKTAVENAVRAVPSFAHTQLGAPFEPPLSVDSEEDARLHAPATAVDGKDADTPDAWIARDKRIMRLTGRHPLNCEYC